MQLLLSSLVVHRMQRRQREILSCLHVNGRFAQSEKSLSRSYEERLDRVVHLYNLVMARGLSGLLSV